MAVVYGDTDCFLRNITVLTCRQLRRIRRHDYQTGDGYDVLSH